MAAAHFRAFIPAPAFCRSTTRGCCLFIVISKTSKYSQQKRAVLISIRNMVRNYKPKPGHRTYTKYDPEIMTRAYREYVEGHESISTIARKYNITKSCLHRRIKLNIPKGIGGQTAFTSEREEHIIKYIHACAPWQYHMQSWDLRILIKFYLDRRPVITKRKFDNNLPGQELVAKFVKRHEDSISQKVIQSLNDDGAITTEAVLSYFHELRMVSDLDPGNIVCYNDVLINDDNVENIKKSEESQTNDIFTMLAASASGEMIQPYISYKEKQCYERGPRRSMMTKQSHQARKRLNVKFFEDWFKTVILPFYEGKSGRKCLIGGYFSSRISLDLIQICKEYDINFVFLPDKSGNLTHPLNLFSQLIYSAWTIIDHQRIRECTEPENVKAKFYEMIENVTNNASEKILDGFKKTGINPLNPVEVLTQLPDYNETTIEDVDEEFEKSDADAYILQVKKEVESGDEYSDNDFDGEMISIENKLAEEEEQNTKKMCSEQRLEDQMTLQDFDMKLSPADFQMGMCEDASVFMPDNILGNDDTAPRSSRGRKLKPRHKEELSSDRDEDDVIYYVPALKQNANKHKAPDAGVLSKKKKPKVLEVSNNVGDKDPLSGSTNLHASATCDEEAITSGHCKNVPCHTQTRLLEEILSSVTRQEKLQERAAVAMEAQTLALENIARLLEQQAANSST